MDTGEDDFVIAIVGEGTYLVNDFIGRAIGEFPSNDRNNTIGASLVAAVADFDPGPVVLVEFGYRLRPG